MAEPTVGIGLRVDPETYEWIQERAAAKGVSVAAVLREAVDHLRAGKNGADGEMPPQVGRFQSSHRLNVLEALRSSQKPLSPAELAQTLGKNALAVRQLLFKMARIGDVRRVDYGKYVAGGVHADTDDTDEIKVRGCLCDTDDTVIQGVGR